MKVIKSLVQGLNWLFGSFFAVPPSPATPTEWIENHPDANKLQWMICFLHERARGEIEHFPLVRVIKGEIPEARIYRNALCPPGLPPRSLIVVSNALTEKPTPVIYTYLAHEMGHISNRCPGTKIKWEDKNRGWAFAFLCAIAMAGFITSSLLLPIQALCLSFAGIGTIGCLLLLSDQMHNWPIRNWLQRREEYFADEFALRVTGDLASNLARMTFNEEIDAQDLEKMSPKERRRYRLSCVLGAYTHPTSTRRRKRLERLGSRLPATLRVAS